MLFLGSLKLSEFIKWLRISGMILAFEVGKEQWL